ncbi:MAG: hypothetical protein CVV44_04285 [Spirochaetae bacterium HGW-Spirochaetae-1]|nr:MAG: hypothetical protein CVV44_04285 [Spirochaetae bacterium HGW-Spirochaetae-1]
MTKSKHRHDLNEDNGKNVDSIETSYNESIVRYYRHVLRKQDEQVLKKIQKIPDDWDEYDKTRLISDPEISEDEKKRLSDIKSKKAWELKFESLNIYYLITIENTMISCLTHKILTDDEIHEAQDSVNSIITEIGGNIKNFKHLLLSLAKRAVSDLYYLMMTFRKYYYKLNVVFDEDFLRFCDDLITFFDEYRVMTRNISGFKKTREFLSRFFPVSANKRGWNIDETALKEFFEEEIKDEARTLAELKRTISAAYLYKKKQKKDYEFIKYYYNERDGKLFRYNFVVNSLSQKLIDQKISADVFEGFKKIRENFINLVRNFENRGLQGFGSPDLSYGQLVEFIFKGSLVLEYYYLRTLQHDELQKFRNDVLHYVEEEYNQLNPDAGRFR